MRTAVVALLLAAAACHAQDAQPAQPPAEAVPPPPATPPAVPPAPAPREVDVTVSGRGELGFNAGIEDSPGDVTITRAAATLALAIPIGDRAGLDTGFRYEFSEYAFDNATGVIPGTDDPWGSVHKESLFVRYGQQQLRQLAWFVGATGSWTAEEGADAGDSFTFGGFGGARYWFSEAFSVGLGLQYATRLEDSDQFLPFPIVSWKINDQWKLTTEREQGRGVGASLIYKPTPKWQLELGGGFEPREFRLDEDGPLPDGVVQESAFPVGFGATYTPTPSLSITGEVGMLLGREFKVLNDGGTEVSEPEVDSGPVIALRLTYRF